MGWRFRKSVRLAPGLSINLGKTGASLSVGPRGAKVTIGRQGTRSTIGVPGTGVSYTSYQSYTPGQPKAAQPSKTKPASGEAKAQKPRQAGQAIAMQEGLIADEYKLDLSFFKRLSTPDDEKAFVDGCRELVRGKEGPALAYLSQAAHLPDGAFLTGMLALKRRDYPAALEHLNRAVGMAGQLGRYFAKYGIVAVLGLDITDRLHAVVGANLAGALLGLTEAYQRLGRADDALACISRLHQTAPEDPVVRLSFAELLVETAGADRAKLEQAVALGEGVDNETDVHLALLLYKGRALRLLGLLDAARDTLTGALRKKIDRGAELLAAVRYERSLVYDALGDKTKANADLEIAYALDPDGLGANAPERK